MKDQKYYQKQREAVLNDILWKAVNGIWTGKKVIQKFDWSVSWFENTKTEDIKMWLHGKEANYNETFYREI